jgi:hypothetical protein
MPKRKNPFLGRWRIVQMEQWDQEFVDMETEGHFTFEKGENGTFQFGLVSGEIDYRVDMSGDLPKIEFSWDGHDEMDLAAGRGWAVQSGDTIMGRFYFHMGDDSDFIAKKLK